MKKKSHNRLRVAPMQICEMIPITDPAEIAELERRIRAAEKVMVDGYARVKKPKPHKRKSTKA